MGSVIFVTGFKGGVGKTTVTAGIASCLSALGRSVLVIDGDFGMRCMDMVLKVESEVLFDCSDLLCGGCEIENAVKSCRSGLDFLPAPMTVPECEIPREAFVTLFDGLKKKYDYVLIDSGADLTFYYRSFASVADEAIVVSMHQSTSVRAAERTASALSEYCLRSIRLVINGFRKKAADSGELPDALDIIRASSIRLAGIVPFDESLPIDQEHGLLPFGDAKKRNVKQYEGAFMNIAMRIEGHRVPLFRGVYTTKKRNYYTTL